MCFYYYIGGGGRCGLVRWCAQRTTTSGCQCAYQASRNPSQTLAVCRRRSRRTGSWRQKVRTTDSPVQQCGKRRIHDWQPPHHTGTVHNPRTPAATRDQDDTTQRRPPQLGGPSGPLGWLVYVVFKLTGLPTKPHPEYEARGLHGTSTRLPGPSHCPTPTRSPGYG